MNKHVQTRLLQAGSALLFMIFTAQLLVIHISVAYWLMLVIPLLLIQPGLNRMQTRSLQWLGFLLLFYFTAGVLQVGSYDVFYRWSGGLSLSISVLMFILSITSIRTIRQSQTVREDRRSES